ncbi:pentapeptide repeat-containing protein [Streptomyces albidoflavus]|uniref:pentapeptide repeat-containing protein n=1 Tax=Streptomyces albidoflavus TaxID=1886 RepID=UPI0033A47E09
MVDDPETQRQADALRSLLYLACPGAPPAAISDTARAIAERSGSQTSPTYAVAEAASLTAVPPRNSGRFHNLSRANLISADLARVNLTGANLTGADLARVNLTGANLTGADLIYANLAGADLTRVNLTRARMKLTNLTGADLTGADLAGGDLTNADLTNADLTGAHLTNVDLTGAILTGANLAGANLAAARQLRLVSGILWNLDTHWPDGLADTAYAWSDEVRPGSYRLRGGTARDRSSTSA